jgi:hypothetical protein
MYYEDLSLNLTKTAVKIFPVRNIGWLTAQHSFPKGEVPQEFIARLAAFCLQSPAEFGLGFHECEFCDPPIEPIENTILGIYLDTTELFVLDNKDTLYLAPKLIYHYILSHKYRPPLEFIKAVLEGPLPDTKLYQKSMQSRAKQVGVAQLTKKTIITGWLSFPNMFEFSKEPFAICDGLLTQQNGLTIKITLWVGLLEQVDFDLSKDERLFTIEGEFIFHEAEKILFVKNLEVAN